MKKLTILSLFLLMVSTALCQNRNGAAPDFVVVQYAGSIGYFSIGTGYDIFKSRARVSGHFGSVPKNQGGPLNIATGKFFYEPWIVRASEKVVINPADVGLMLSYHFGDDFKLSVPDYFKSGNYYWWHTAMRLHLAVESSATVNFDPGRKFRSLTGYLEFNSNDLYIVSYINNTSALELGDFIKIGTGIRLSF